MLARARAMQWLLHKPMHYTASAFHQDRGVIFLLVLLLPPRNRDGKHNGICGFAHDLLLRVVLLRNLGAWIYSAASENNIRDCNLNNATSINTSWISNFSDFRRLCILLIRVSDRGRLHDWSSLLQVVVACNYIIMYSDKPCVLQFH